MGALLARLFGKKDVRILMVGLGAAGVRKGHARMRVYASVRMIVCARAPPETSSNTLRGARLRVQHLPCAGARLSNFAPNLW